MWQESFLHTGISYKLSYHAIKYPFFPQNGEKNPDTAAFLKFSCAPLSTWSLSGRLCNPKAA